jgi:predicted MFS family arabinose efflux permease
MRGRTPGYSGYVLTVLLLAYTFNSFDRAIISLLLEPIRLEFGTTDTQLGLLTGLAFGLFYSTLAIPVATLADRWSRSNVLLLSMGLWTLMTVLCGLAGSFLALLLARIGVGIGQSGNNPASHSLLASYFPADRRASALGIVALGAPAGAMLAGLFGGWGSEQLGWRMTIMLAAAPGLMLVPLLLTVREPALPVAPPGATDAPPLRDALKGLWSMAAFRHLCIASALHSLSMYAASSFNPAYLARSHGWEGGQIGYLSALTGVTGLAGALLGGLISDRLGARRGEVRWQLWVPAMATLAVAPVQIVAYLGSGTAMVVALLVSSMLSLMFFGPSYATAQTLAAPRTRAVAAALLLFSKAIVGMGMGPLLVGMASDLLAPIAGEHSLRLGLLVAPVFNVWAALHFFHAAKQLGADIQQLRAQTKQAA